MDIAHALKVALETGTVKIGLSESLASAKAKKARLLIVASTCPDSALKESKRLEKIPIFHFEGTAVELGAALGKPFPVSALAVIDAGSSALLSLETGS